MKALLDQVPHRRLFCVGDDWQSIFRFAGSDVGIMTSFGERFGFARTTHLDRTFRFGEELLKVSSGFILKNTEPLAAFFHHGPPASRKVCGAGGCGPAGFRGCPPPAARIRPRCYTVVVKSRSVSVPPERPRGIKGSRTRRSARGSGLSLMGARPRLKRGRNAPGQTSVMIAQTVASGVVDVDRIDVEVLCA